MQSEDPAVTLVGHWSYPKLTKDNYWYPVKKFNGKFMEETGEKAQRNPLKKTVYAIGSVHCASVELIVNGKSILCSLSLDQTLGRGQTCPTMISQLSSSEKSTTPSLQTIQASVVCRKMVE